MAVGYRHVLLVRRLALKFPPPLLDVGAAPPPQRQDLLHRLLRIATIAAILLALATTTATATDGVPHRAAATASSTITFDIATSSPPTSLRCDDITPDITAIQRRHFAAAQSFIALSEILLRLYHPQATHLPRP